MSPPRTMTTTVQSGGLIEVRAPDLPEGQRVEVTIRPTLQQSVQRSILAILSECPGGLLFKSAEDVDAYIREERESWDR